MVDRRLRLCSRSWIRSRTYDGVEVLRTLNVSRTTLYSILCWTGSQCNVLSNGLVWDRLGASRMNLKMRLATGVSPCVCVKRQVCERGWACWRVVEMSGEDHVSTTSAGQTETSHRRTTAINCHSRTYQHYLLTSIGSLYLFSKTKVWHKSRFRPIVPWHWQMQKKDFKFSVFGPWPVLYIGGNDVTESMVTLRLPFCGYNLISIMCGVIGWRFTMLFK